MDGNNIMIITMSLYFINFLSLADVKSVDCHLHALMCSLVHEDDTLKVGVV